MKSIVLAASIALMSVAPVMAQDLGDKAVSLTVSGMTFERSLNGAAENTKIEGGKVTLRSDAKRDNFRDPGGNPPNITAPALLSKVDNSKPFTFIAKVTPELITTYDAGTLYLWVKDDLWLKMAMEQDERGLSRMVTVRTVGTSDDNNHDVIAQKDVYMKISSDTKTVGFYYSLDKKKWQLIRLFKNDYPSELWLGISAQSPIGEGMTAAFEDISLTGTSIKDFRLGE